MQQRDWQSILVRLAAILAALLVVLASAAVLFIAIGLIQRVGSVLVLFALGAIIAYVLTPAVNRMTAMLGKRWAGTAAVYLGLVVILAILAVSLFQPLLSQSSSLVSALNKPTTGSFRLLTRVGEDADVIEHEVQTQVSIVQAGGRLPRQRTQRVQAEIAKVTSEVNELVKPPPSQPGRNRNSKTPQAQVRIPPSYLSPLQTAALALSTDYGRAVQHPGGPGLSPLNRSVSDARNLAAAAQSLRHTVSSTPILLLDAQTWADQHHIVVNVQQSAGQALKKMTDQAASLLNNTAGILSQTASLLLDLFLTLIISVYFVLDGARMVQKSIALVPEAYHKQATYFVTSLDSILGAYMRAQILLALLAGLLAGVGAAVLGVPYPLVIGVSTFFLQLLPVIGPILVYVVPMVIAFIFTPMPTPLIFLAYLMVMEQVVTNIIGPRVSSQSVGIHPLEAMAAALLGYPIGGFLGSFLAVPVVALFHVVAKEAYASWKAKKSSPSSSTDAPATAVESTKVEHTPPTSDGALPPTSASANGRVE